MPSAYAHYSFGQNVYTLLDKDLKERIDNHKEAFHMGLQGPDFLFFYYPLYKNSVNRVGYAIHYQPASVFFKKALPVIREKGDNSPEYAYLLGFLCHFMLDSESHPYVQSKVSALAFDHVEMETEFDKYLLMKNGIDPYTYRFTDLIFDDDALAKTIANVYRAYPTIRETNVKTSLHMFKIIKQFLYAPTTQKQKRIELLMKVTGQHKHMQGHVLRTESNPKADQTNPKLYSIYHDAVRKTALLLSEFHQAVQKGQELPKRLDRNFE